MAWIETIDDDGAEGPRAEIYTRINKQRGKIANIWKAGSLNPEALQAHLDLYMAILFADCSLSREDAELLATVVSARNGCGYCTRHHAEALKHYWKSDERVEQLAIDFRNARLSPKQRTLVAYGVKLTNLPQQMAETDTEALRDAGYTDREILDIVLIVGYFNFVNRIAQGLGVQMTDEEAAGYEY
ncbi:peroxidase-related enzyme [bacterium]|nr:peroxidase-related enzyme [bacterium]